MSKVINGITYYLVRFLNYEATDLLGTADVEAGGDATPLAPEPEIIEGMTFVGWNVDITCVNRDMTVRPTYKGSVNIYTVNFLNYAGVDYLSSQKVEEGEDAVPPEPEVIEGMRFVRWNADYTNIHSDKTIRPIYESSCFTVQFLNMDGTQVWSVQLVEEGEDAIAPTPDIVPGYIFIGWSTSFINVTTDITVYSRYREIPPHPMLRFYKTMDDGSSGDFIKSYFGVNSCTVTRKLDGECTINFKMLTRQMEGIVTVKNRLELDGLVFGITEVKKSISNGLCYTEMTGEHVSYLLNDDDYIVTAYEKTGTVRDILSSLLSGTPFTVGTVDFTNTVTLRVNTEVTRRACVMQLLAQVKGEIEYYGYTIGIRRHVGKEETTDIMKNGNVQDISYSYNATQQRYSFSLELYDKRNIELGDEIYMFFKPLGINTNRRIVGMEWNPFNYKEVNVTVGAYVPTLNDSLYQLVSEVSDIRETTAKYTVEFGEMIGNGTFYFTRAYKDRPYFHYNTDDGSIGKVTLNKKSGSAFQSYVGATLSEVNSTTSTLLVFYCTVPDETEDEE